MQLQFGVNERYPKEIIYLSHNCCVFEKTFGKVKIELNIINKLFLYFQLGRNG